MSEKKKILSVGIDIGTSTLQLVISELGIENDAPPWMIPKLEISDKKVVYKSAVHFTPMKNERMLDMKKINEIIEKEYKQSGIPKEKIETGAIIITGESANKENANASVMELSEYAGDFVVAVAGPDLEAILAGYGSGAASISEEEHSKIMNFDIGGGTTNTAFFEDGNVEDAWGAHIGGRLIRLDKNGKVTYVSSKLKKFLKEKKLKCYKDDTVTYETIAEICTCLAETLANMAQGKRLTIGEKSLEIYHPPARAGAVKFSFSGGVGESVYRNEDKKDLELCMRYGDIGPVLGGKIREIFEKRGLSIQEVPEKIRATVIGAGSYSMRLSGSTVSFQEDELPIKNIPVVKLKKCSIDNMSEAMRSAANVQIGQKAFAFQGLKSPSYSEIKQMAEQIWEYYQENQEKILLLIEEDMAKALGQTLRIYSKDKRQIICLDGIWAKNGDYVDFCKAVSDSMLVVIKTLIFKN